MKLAPWPLHESLREWKNRRCLPKEGEPGHDAFFDGQGDLANLFGAGDFLGPAAKLTVHQRRAGAMLAFSNAMPWDGLVVGVVVNQPELLRHVREAATALKLKRVSSLVAKMLAILPAAVFKLRSGDQRLTCLDNDPRTLKLSALEDSALAENARCDMMVAATRIILDHPEEFFKPAKVARRRAKASATSPETRPSRRRNRKNRTTSYA